MRRRLDRDSPVAADALTEYLDAIGRYPMLSRFEERALGRRIRRGDQAAANELVCANLRFVVAIAKHYQGRSVALLDLIHEGNLGLIRAAHRFDETKGIKFISYAVWWIRQAILHALAQQSRIVRVPLNRTGALRRIGRRANLLLQRLGREPTAREIASELNLTEEEVAVALAIPQRHVSLDAPMTLGEETSLLDYLPDSVNPPPDEETVQESVTESIEDALRCLSAREARILRLYFGLNGAEPMTLEEIGGLYGITRERIRQIRDRGLRKLRAMMAHLAVGAAAVANERATSLDVARSYRAMAPRGRGGRPSKESQSQRWSSLRN